MNCQELRDQFETESIVVAREIPLSRRSVTGLLPSRKNAGMVPFESALERDFATLLEFDPNVVSYQAQPVKLEYTGPDGRRRIGYPDFLVAYSVGDKRRYELCDVKYREELFSKWVALKPRLRAARRYAFALGHSYRIKTEIEIRSPLLENAKFLLPYMRSEPDPTYEQALRRALHGRPGLTAQGLLEICSSDAAVRALMIPTMWCLVGRREIIVDLNLPISMRSPTLVAEH
jgi:hypothetical protein